jgi:hypothetical protein
MKPTKPIRLFHSALTNTVYATRDYKEVNGHMVSAAGVKTDVTKEACIAVLAHVAYPCERADCVCDKFREHMTVTELPRQ